MNRIVSFENEDLILVDALDNEIGYDTKANCHDNDGRLHRAFSLFIFDEAGDLLVQKRSRQKRLWPLYWSNSCCGHPLRGEGIEDAVNRRLFQEVGVTSKVNFIYKFQYQVRYQNLGAENEFCSVYLGKTTDPVQSNVNEIAEWRFEKPDSLTQQMNQFPEQFTPWFKLEWERLNREFSSHLKAYTI